MCSGPSVADKDAIITSFLELELEADGEAREEDLAGSGIFAEVLEAVAGVDAYNVVGEASDDTITDVIVIGGSGVDIGMLCVVGGGTIGGVATEGVSVAATAGVDAEIPVEAVAEESEGTEADALEEFNVEDFVHLEAAVDDLFVIANVGLSDAQRGFKGVDGSIVETEMREGHADANTQTIGLAVGTKETETEAPTGRPEVDRHFSTLSGDGQAEAEIDIPTVFGVATPFGGGEIHLRGAVVGIIQHIRVVRGYDIAKKVFIEDFGSTGEGVYGGVDSGVAVKVDYQGTVGLEGEV